MRPTDLALLRTPGVPTVSPDGRIAVVAVSRLDLDDDEYRSQLWAVPVDGSAPARPLTTGHRDTAPAFSPDGRWLAYLSAEPAGRPQLHVLPAAGGAARRLTEHLLGAGAPVWSPDSRRLAYTARIPEPGRYGTVDGIGAGEEPPRLITTLKYRQDDGGFLAARRSQVFVLALPEDFDDDTTPAPEPVQVTTGDADCADVTWRPDGAELAFSPRGIRGPIATWSATCTPSGPTDRGCGRSPDRGATAPSRRTTRPGRSTSPPSLISVPTGWTSSPGRPSRAGWTPQGVRWCRSATRSATIAATRPRPPSSWTGPSSSGCNGGGGGGCWAWPWALLHRSRWSTGPSRCADSRRPGVSSWRWSRTTAPQAS